jgi:hypothetical protein
VQKGQENICYCKKWNIRTSYEGCLQTVLHAEPLHFDAAPAPGRINDAAPAPAPILKFILQQVMYIRVG